MLNSLHCDGARVMTGALRSSEHSVVRYRPRVFVSNPPAEVDIRERLPIFIEAYGTELYPSARAQLSNSRDSIYSD